MSTEHKTQPEECEHSIGFWDAKRLATSLYESRNYLSYERVCFCPDCGAKLLVTLNKRDDRTPLAARIVPFGMLLLAVMKCADDVLAVLLLLLLTQPVYFIGMYKGYRDNLRHNAFLYQRIIDKRKTGGKKHA